MRRRKTGLEGDNHSLGGVLNPHGGFLIHRIVKEADDLETKAKEIGCKALAVEEAWDPVGGGGS